MNNIEKNYLMMPPGHSIVRETSNNHTYIKYTNKKKRDLLLII